MWYLPYTEPMMAVNPMPRTFGVGHDVSGVLVTINRDDATTEHHREPLQSMADADHRLIQLDGGFHEVAFYHVPGGVPITACEHDEIAGSDYFVEILIGTIGHGYDAVRREICVPCPADAIIAATVVVEDPLGKRNT